MGYDLLEWMWPEKKERAEEQRLDTQMQMHIAEVQAALDANEKKREALKLRVTTLLGKHKGRFLGGGNHLTDEQKMRSRNKANILQACLDALEGFAFVTSIQSEMMSQKIHNRNNFETNDGWSAYWGAETDTAKVVREVIDCLGETVPLDVSGLSL